MTDRSCKGVNAAGEPCGAPASVVGEDGYCPAHRPGGADRMLALAMKGGQAAKRARQTGGLEPGELPDLHAPQDVARALAVVAEAVATGRLGHREAVACTRALRAWLDARDAGEVEDRIGEMRAAIEAWKRSGDPGAVLELVRS